MGYPMCYSRAMGRNHLNGGYHRMSASEGQPDDGRSLIRGDLQRVELDMTDDTYAPRFAAQAGITVDQYRAVMRAFFGLPEPDCAECQRLAGVAWSGNEPGRQTGVGPWGPAQVRGRCSVHYVCQ